MVKEYEYDLVVVGGGPAGSSAAKSAADKGLRVAILERESSIAETVRTSGVTWIDSIDEFGIPADCYNPIRDFSFCTPNTSVTISSKQFKAAVLDVRKTYRWLADQSVSAGADLYTSHNVTDVLCDNKSNIAGVRAITSTNTVDFKAKVVIDASGFKSVICKLMNIAPKWKRFGVGAEIEARVDYVDPDRWWLMVGEIYSPAGYAWIFPLSDKMVRIGVGVGRPESTADPKILLDNLIKTRPGPLSDLGNIEQIEFHYGMIPNDGTTRKTVFDNLMLVGDAAGQANPLVLEGIRYAIRFGRLAGKTAAQCINASTTQQDLQAYEDEWRHQIDAKVRSAKRVQDRWLKLDDPQWDRELEIISHLNIDEFLDFIRADFGLASIAKLATRHPKIMVRQLFSLIRN